MSDEENRKKRSREEFQSGERDSGQFDNEPLKKKFKLKIKLAQSDDSSPIPSSGNQKRSDSTTTPSSPVFTASNINRAASPSSRPGMIPLPRIPKKNSASNSSMDNPPILTVTPSLSPLPSKENDAQFQTFQSPQTPQPQTPSESQSFLRRKITTPVIAMPEVAPQRRKITTPIITMPEKLDKIPIPRRDRESISTPSSTEREKSSKSKVRVKELIELLEKLKNEDAEQIFWYPPPTSIPGYYQLIMEPMDFQTLSCLVEGKPLPPDFKDQKRKKKYHSLPVEARRYRRLHDFWNDLLLIFNNSCIFNVEDTVFYAEAKRLQKMAEDHLNTVWNGKKDLEIAYDDEPEHATPPKKEKKPKKEIPPPEEKEEEPEPAEAPQKEEVIAPVPNPLPPPPPPRKRGRPKGSGKKGGAVTPSASKDKTPKRPYKKKKKVEEDEDEEEDEDIDLDLELNEKMEQEEQNADNQQEEEEGVDVQHEVGTKKRGKVTRNRKLDLPAQERKDLFCNLIKTLEDSDANKIFHEPLGKEENPEYFKTILKPMDFSTLRKKIARSQVFTLNQFLEHLELIFDNATVFNPEDSIYYQEAVRLKTEMMNLFKDMEIEIEKLEEIREKEREELANKIKQGVAEAKQKGEEPDASGKKGIKPTQQIFFTLNAEDVKKLTNFVWEYLSKDDVEKFFKEPVSKADYPNYFEIIKDPTDLKTIKAKIDAGTYGSSWENFENDLDLMFSNCRLFNPPKSAYHEEANRLQRLFRNSLRKKIVAHLKNGKTIDQIIETIPLPNPVTTTVNIEQVNFNNFGQKRTTRRGAAAQEEEGNLEDEASKMSTASNEMMDIDQENTDTTGMNDENDSRSAAQKKRPFKKKSEVERLKESGDQGISSSGQNHGESLQSGYSFIDPISGTSTAFDCYHFGFGYYYCSDFTISDLIEPDPDIDDFDLEEFFNSSKYEDENDEENDVFYNADFDMDENNKKRRKKTHQPQSLFDIKGKELAESSFMLYFPFGISVSPNSNPTTTTLSAAEGLSSSGSTMKSSGSSNLASQDALAAASKYAAAFHKKTFNSEIHSWISKFVTDMCARLLDDLVKFDVNSFFSTPIELNKVPSYKSIISKPMDFSSMKKKLQKAKYMCLKQFEKDLRRIIVNCCKFNDTDSIFVVEAQRMWKYMKEKFQRMLQKIQFVLQSYAFPNKRSASNLKNSRRPDDRQSINPGITGAGMDFYEDDWFVHNYDSVFSLTAAGAFGSESGSSGSSSSTSGGESQSFPRPTLISGGPKGIATVVRQINETENDEPVSILKTFQIGKDDQNVVEKQKKREILSVPPNDPQMITEQHTNSKKIERIEQIVPQNTIVKAFKERIEPLPAQNMELVRKLSVKDLYSQFFEKAERPARLIEIEKILEENERQKLKTLATTQEQTTKNSSFVAFLSAAAN